MSEVLTTWLNNVTTYPPAEIFYEKYGIEAKAEERIKTICEELYRFCFPDEQKNHLGDLKTAYRNFEVAYVIGFDKIKPEYIVMVKDELLKEIKNTISVLDTLFKKDQILQQYYAPWKVKFADINSVLYDMTKDYV